MGLKPRNAAIPAGAMLARLDEVGEAWIARQLEGFAAAMRRAGQNESFIAERLAGASETYAARVAEARQHIAEHAHEPETFVARINNSDARAMLVAACAARTELGPEQAIESDQRDHAIVWSDVKVAGDLRVSGTLFVAGALEAGGAIEVGETGVLVVGRQIRAPMIGGEGWIICAGDVRARVVWGSYEAGSFDVGGRVEAELAVFQDHGHNFETGGVGQYIDNDSAALEAAVSAETLSDAGDLGRVDLSRLRKLAVSGEPILRT